MDCRYTLGDGVVPVTDQYQCPFCDFTAGSKGSVKAHITRKTDESHKGLSGPDFTDDINPVSISDAPSDETSDETTESNQGGVVPSDHRVSDDGGSSGSGGQCCSSPDLRGSANDVFELDSGQYVRLESGDKICVNCDEIHE